jgi:o-succinylbenzoate synthase
VTLHACSRPRWIRAVDDPPGQRRERARSRSVTLRLTGIELREIRLPLREPFRISSGEVTERRILLARITDVDGFVAWSECVAGEYPNYSPETIDTARLALREWFGPRLLGRPIPGAAAVDAILASDVRGHRMARATLEMAIWALESERTGVPLARAIGGTRAHVDVGISIGIQPSPSDLVDRARAALDAGYRKIKLKIAPGADIEFVAAVRDALGAAAPLMVDANNAYTLADTPTLMQLDAFDLIMIEQPLDARGPRPSCGAAALAAHAASAWMSRSHRRSCARHDHARKRAHRQHQAGPRRRLHIIHRNPRPVRGHGGMPVWCGGMLESGIGRATTSRWHRCLTSHCRRHLAQLTLLGARHRDARVDHGRGLNERAHGTGHRRAVDVDRIDDLTGRTCDTCRWSPAEAGRRPNGRLPGAALAQRVDHVGETLRSVDQLRRIACLRRVGIAASIAPQHVLVLRHGRDHLVDQRAAVDPAVALRLRLERVVQREQPRPRAASTTRRWKRWSSVNTRFTSRRRGRLQQVGVQ